jgi:hypothetical protein
VFPAVLHWTPGRSERRIRAHPIRGGAFISEERHARGGAIALVQASRLDTVTTLRVDPYDHYPR